MICVTRIHKYYTYGNNIQYSVMINIQFILNIILMFNFILYNTIIINIVL